MAPRKNAKAKARPESEMFTIYADILQETEATPEHEGAILINCGEAEKVWLPISQIEFSGERDDTGVAIVLPDWLAAKSGLVDGQGRRSEAAPDDDQESPAATAGEVVSAVMDGLAPPAQPETFTFTADVAAVYDEKYVLQVTNEQGGTASLEFNKGDVTFDGQDIEVELEEGYEGIQFTVPWELAVEKHLPEFLGVSPLPVEAEGRVGADVAVQFDDDGTPKSHPYRHKLRTETVCKEIELSDDEKIAYGKDLVEHLENEADYKETASSYSSRARNERKQADKVIDILKAGREERNITCDVVADYNAGQLVYVESEWPYREIQRRPLTDKDRQLTLFDTTNTGYSAPLGEDPRHRTPSNASTEIGVPEEAPAEPETITFYGQCDAEELNDGSGSIIFTLESEDGTLFDWVVPTGEIVSLQADMPETEIASITVSRAFALESGVIKAPEEEPGEEEPAAAGGDGETDGDMERSCGTCSHLHDVPDGDEPSPCTTCGQEPDLPNWQDGLHVPPSGQEQQPATVQ